MVKRTLILLLFILQFNALLTGQNCADAGKDTTVCGFKHLLTGSPSDGTWSYLCDSAIKYVAIEDLGSGMIRVNAAVCGTYKFVYQVNSLPCTSTDTIVINFENTSYKTEEIGYEISLGYPATFCQPSLIDSCGQIRNLQGIIPPLPIWKIKMLGKCDAYSAEPTIYGSNSSTCLADSIVLSLKNKQVNEEVTWNTPQNAFITLDSNNRVQNNQLNTFFNFITGAILNELDLKCPLQKCFGYISDACTDTTEIDTLNLIVPIHLGGNWFVKQDTGLLKLSSTNTIILNGNNYVLNLPKGANYYGPDNLIFELFSTDISGNPIDLIDNKEIQIVWKEIWTYDTIPFIYVREIDQDKCYCNGSFLSFEDFTIPDIPEFHCELTKLKFSPKVSPHISGPNIVCTGSFIDIAVDSTFSSYSWSNGDKIRTTSVFNSGTYTVTVTNINGCSGIDSFEVKEVLPPTLSIEASKKVLCRGECVVLTGISDSSNLIVWNVVDSTKSITVCPQNDEVYFVQAIDKTGCKTELSQAIKVYNSPKPILGKDLTLNCSITQLKIVPIDADLGIARRSEWSGPGITTTQKDSITITVERPGIFVFEVVDSISSCRGTDTIVIDIDTIKPKANAGIDQELNCLNPTVSLLGDSSDFGAGYSLLWSGPGINAGNNSEINPLINRSGSYILKIKNINNECQSTDTVFVSSNFSTPVADAGLNRFIFCDSLGVTLGGFNTSSGTDILIQWTGPGIDSANSNLIRPFVKISGTYTLITINQNSHCSDTSTVVVTAPDTLAKIKLVKSPDLGCNVDSVTISAAQSIGKKLHYTWSGPLGIIGINNDTIVVNSIGKYYLFIYDSTSHCSDFDSITIFDTGGRPFVNAGPDRTITCELSSVILSGSVNIPTANSTVLWNGSGINGGNSAILQPSVTTPGQYILIITDKRNNCTGTDTMYVLQNLIKPKLDLGLDFTLNCHNDTVDVLAKIEETKPSYDFRWIGPGVTPTNQRFNPLAIAIPGLYVATITTPNKECTVFDTLNISIDTIRPYLDIADTLWFSCENKLINYTVNDFSKLDSVEWFDILNKKIITNNLGISLSFNQEGVYRYVAYYKNGCVRSNIFHIIPYITINVAKPVVTPSCTDVGTGSAKINILAGNGPFTLSLDGSRPDTLTYFTNLTPGPYKVRIYDRNGLNCFVDVFFDVTALISLPDSLGKEPFMFQLCQDTTLYADSILLKNTQFRYPFDSVNFDWKKNGNIVSPKNKVLLIEEKGKYELVISNKNGCGSATLVFNVEQDESLANKQVKLPNIFTPNELTNNTYKPVYDPGVLFEKGAYSLKIYNRWGKAVFETSDPLEVWDGTYRGLQAPADTYIVIFTGKLDLCGASREASLKSTLNLVR
ncbi:MAG: gliding motility-associated C-terminal domain-containing protein [Saprospiraceae bacterium]